mmetsp:Transcript_32991/g.50497  ORF Transcript_32991/g.50497 Transcript_32991/m.50497 type:complete len:200 (-) Transcript_32991:2572-3171(-)
MMSSSSWTFIRKRSINFSKTKTLRRPSSSRMLKSRQRSKSIKSRKSRCSWLRLTSERLLHLLLHLRMFRLLPLLLAAVLHLLLQCPVRPQQALLLLPLVDLLHLQADLLLHLVHLLESLHLQVALPLPVFLLLQVLQTRLKLMILTRVPACSRRRTGVRGRIPDSVLRSVKVPSGQDSATLLRPRSSQLLKEVSSTPPT